MRHPAKHRGMMAACCTPRAAWRAAAAARTACSPGRARSARRGGLLPDRTANQDGVRRMAVGSPRGRAWPQPDDTNSRLRIPPRYEPIAHRERACTANRPPALGRCEQERTGAGRAPSGKGLSGNGPKREGPKRERPQAVDSRCRQQWHSHTGYEHPPADAQDQHVRHRHHAKVLSKSRLDSACARSADNEGWAQSGRTAGRPTVTCAWQQRRREAEANTQW